MQTIANNCKQLQTIANNCKQLQTIANKLTISFLLGSLTLSSCNENEAEESLSEIMSRQVIQEVDFFELEKGDTLPKYIHRRKPEFTEEDDVEILFSTENTENQVKVMLYPDNAQGKVYESDWSQNRTYISDIRIYDKWVEYKNQGNNENLVGAVKYRIIPIDLNEKAGGDYLYFCYGKTAKAEDGITALCIENDYVKPLANTTTHIIYSSIFDNFGLYYDHSDINSKRYNNYYPVDLNKGAGGEYLYLRGIKRSKINYLKENKSMYDEAVRYSGGNLNSIKELRVVSTSKKPFDMFKYVQYSADFTGWTLIQKDLNAGAGGKYIYLLYKK